MSGPITSVNDLADLKEKVFQKTKARINSELEQLKQGTHPRHNEKTQQFRRDMEQRLKNSENWYTLQVTHTEEQFMDIGEAITKETEKKMKAMQRKIKQELEAMKADILEEQAALNGNIKLELLKDKEAIPRRTLRTHAEKKRKRLFGEWGLILDDEEEDSEADAYRLLEMIGIPTRDKKRGKKTKENVPRLLMTNDKMYLDKWEVDEDLAQLTKKKSSGSRSRRPTSEK
eukprot:m.75906 g.75906  ORF g.75906 m.75906 type:complete len:230 (-) comp12529_c0_seq1:34-723(-)